MSEEYPRRECEHAIARAVAEEVAPVKTRLNDIYQRMFVDNGKKSIQSSLSSLNSHIKVQYAMLGILIMGLLGLAWRALQ
jgi:tetrahydromethanopterin S-methyltransferase subunit A